jgi:hypothetical protein
MKNIKFLLVIFIIVTGITACYYSGNNHITDIVLRGKYLGQTPPDTIPELFATGFVSTSLYTRDIAISEDGNEIFFCISNSGFNLIFTTRMENGIWTNPIPASFISDYKYMFYEPCFSPDGNRLFFLSNMPKIDGEIDNQDIWYSDKINGKWSSPVNIGEPICTENAEFFPSLTNEGTLYFTRQIEDEKESFIYRSRLVDGKYSFPEKLGSQVNIGSNRFNAFIGRDESYIIVPAMGMEDGMGGVDYYIVFRDKNDNWSKPINLGDRINSSKGGEWSPYVSPDGEYFFFMATKQNPNLREAKTITQKLLLDNFCNPQNGNASIYWIKADFINDLNPFKVQNSH